MQHVFFLGGRGLAGVIGLFLFFFNERLLQNVCALAFLYFS